MALTDDQRAMIRLLAQREEGYEDIAALMGLSVDEVRARVKEALEELDGSGGTPEAPPPAKVEEPEQAEPVKVTESPQPPKEPAPSKPAPLPPAPKSQRSRPSLSLPRDPGKRAAIFAGLGVVVVLIVLLATGALGGDGSSSSSTTTAATENSTTSAAETTGAENSSLTQAVLSPVNSGSAEGRALFGRVKKTPVLQVEAHGLEPSPKGSSYTIWLYKSPKLALRVGAVHVGKSGGLAAQFPIPTELLAYVSSGAFDQIDISLTNDAAYKAEVAKAKQAKRLPAYTGEDVLRGKITGPAVKAAGSNGG